MCNYIAMLVKTPASNDFLHETRLCDITELAVTVDNSKIINV
jgi:hypothetical protein